MSSRIRALRSLAPLLLLAALAGCGGDSGPGTDVDPVLAAQGKEIFRFDTFGDDSFWTDTLRLHEVIQSGVSPSTALAVGLKVDADKLPPGILGTVDLNDPATTVALLKLGAVIGVKGTVATVNGKDSLTAVGITCALCHSTVDNTVAPGIGHRLDGWPNRDLNVGAIVALSPALQDPAVQAVLTSWGPGKYDAYWNHDGRNNPTVIPPAFGLHDVALETFTGEGPVSYWNAYVAVTQMHGHGSFSDPKLGIHVEQTPDLVTSKLPALREYQHSLPAPTPPPGSFDVAAAARGKALFTGQARCSQCHTGSSFTDAGKRLYSPAEVGMDPTLAERATTGKYRTTPLRGVWQHPPYFHDGSAATLDAVVSHYDQLFQLNLTPDQKRDLVEYLKSL
jgi:mono/diheme cytochrome c family protein